MESQDETKQGAGRLWIQLASLSCFVACIGDFVVSSCLGLLYPGYDFIHQSESLLGTSDSPVAGWVAGWGIIFACLLTFFALGLRQAFGRGHTGISWLSWLIILYGLGEGIFSGLFPYDFVGGELTFSGKVHALFSSIGEAALYFVPLAAWVALSRQYPVIKRVSGIAWIAGSLFLLLFGASKLGLINYRGLWQRLFMGVYFLYLMYLAFLTGKQVQVTSRHPEETR